MKLVLFVQPSEYAEHQSYPGSREVEYKATVEGFTGSIGARLQLTEIARPPYDPQTLGDLDGPSLPRIVTREMLGNKVGRKFRVTIEEVDSDEDEKFIKGHGYPREWLP